MLAPRHYRIRYAKSSHAACCFLGYGPPGPTTRGLPTPELVAAPFAYPYDSPRQACDGALTACLGLPFTVEVA